MTDPTARVPRFRLYLLAFGLAALLFLLLLQVVPGSIFLGLDRRASDWAWRLEGQSEPERRVIIVDLDEKTLAATEAWPWPRSKMAALSARLTELGAAQQIVDILFPDQRTGDAALGAALVDGKAVLANVFALDQGEAVESGRLIGDIGGLPCRPPLPVGRGFIGLAPTLAEAGHLGGGHITPRIDSDGSVRRIPAVICYRDKAYPALALAAYWQGGEPMVPGAPSAQLRPGRGWLEPAWWLEHPRVPAAVPLDDNGDLIVPYGLAPGALVSVSAADVLEDRVPKGLLEGAWVIIGATALGLGDAVPTPHGGAVGGVSVHAQLISGLLDGNLPYIPVGRGLLLLAPVLLLCGLLAATAHRRGRLPVYVLPLLSVVAGLMMMGLHVLALHSLRWSLGWSQAALFVVCFGLLLTSAEFARARFEKDRLYAHLSSYLPAPVAQALVGRPAEAGAVAERRDVTVMVADIRNFSSFCEARPPEEAAGVLHDFIGIATRVVEASGGLIEAVQGDAIMAIWNGSRPCEDHAQKAAVAAKALLPAVERSFPRWPEGELQPLALGIGIESGDALIGSFGPPQRRIHTALGGTVTVANALQVMTAELACPILVGPEAASRLQGVELRSQGAFILEGLTKAHTLYALQVKLADAGA